MADELTRSIWVPAACALLVVASVACTAHSPAPAAAPVTERTSAPADAETAGARAFLEEIAALGRSALLRRTPTSPTLSLQPDSGRPLVYLDPEEQSPPTGAVRRLYVFADTELAFADGSCLRMTVLIGPTGFRVGAAKAAATCGRRLPSPPALNGLKATLASISNALAGHGGAVPWFTGVDARACTGEEAACQAIPGKPDDAALAEIRARLEKAGSAVGLVVGELGPIEIAADGRMFYVEVDLTDDTAAVARIKVKQVRP